LTLQIYKEFPKQKSIFRKILYFLNLFKTFARIFSKSSESSRELLRMNFPNFPNFLHKKKRNKKDGRPSQADHPQTKNHEKQSVLIAFSYRYHRPSQVEVPF